MIYLHRPTRLFLSLALLAVFLTSADAQAQNVLEATLLRQWDIPPGTSPYVAPIDSSVDGTVLVVLGRGSEEEELCIIAVADQERARAYNFRHEFSATRCVDAVAHPEGGFFVRGESPMPSEHEISGFSARIDDDGKILWILEDEALLETLPPPTGPGEFEGNYGHPLSGLAYDPAQDLLMGLVLGTRSLAAGERPIMQAFIIQGATGELLLNGRVFGPNRNDLIVDLVARQGDFLLRTEGLIDRETRFYAFDGQRTASLLRLGDRNWAHREILAPLSYHPSSGTFVLSTPGPNLLAMAPAEENRELWSRELASHEFDYDPGLPIQVWAGAEMVGLLYQHPESQRLSLRLLDAENGEELAISPVDSLISEDLIGLTRGDAGELHLLAIDPHRGVFREYELHLGDSSQSPGTGEAGDDSSGGCSQSPATPPGALIFLFAALSLFFYRRNATKKRCRAD